MYKDIEANPMMQTELLSYLEQETTMDCRSLVERATSGVIGGFSGLPTAVNDTTHIYLSLALKGLSSYEELPLLKKALLNHLELSKRHALLWLDKAPKPNDLVEIWHLQAHSLQCWSRFVTSYWNLHDLSMAYKIAYEDHLPGPLSFQNDGARQIFLAMLKNEQQDFIGGSKKTAVHIIDKALINGLDPTHSRLLDLLFNGENQSVDSLIRELFGSRFIDSTNKDNLSRRVSDLNVRLKKEWGQPPGKKWIVRKKINGESFYALNKGKELN